MKFNRASTGFGAFNEKQESIDKARESRRGRLFRFYPPGDESEVAITFLHDEPVVWMEHDMKDGSGKFYQAPCTADEGECEHCGKSNARPVCGWLVFDHREFTVDEYNDKNEKTGKKKTIHGNCKLLVRGKTDALILQKLSKKYGGLTTREFSIYKTGEQKSTRWNYTPEEATRLTEKKLAGYMAGLPDKYADMTPEEVVFANIFGIEEEAEEKPKRNESKRDRLRRQEEEEDEPEDDIPEDDEDEPAPRRSGLRKKPPVKRRTLGRRD